MPAITTLDNFLDLLRRSGAIDPRRLDSYLANKYGGRTPEDPARIADDLIEAGLLTKYHTEPLLAGRPQRYTLSGKYRMIDRLGSGGMASVFLCEHRVMRRRVAVKMLPPSVASNPSTLDRFHREARAMAGVHHPNIVGAHDVDQDGKIHFIVMEYVDGTNFHELIRRVGPLPVERAAHYIAQSARGLQHAHDKGLVHRDIKPANLLLDRTGTVKILDLGLALVFQSNDDNLTRDHDANSILGTAEYLAPEQAVDSHNVDHRADIYSLGMTFYFILTAQTPFGEGTTAQKLIWHQLRQPKPVREHRPDVSEELWAVLAKMLAKDPKDRYQTMQEVADALSPWTSAPISPPSDREMPKPLADISTESAFSESSPSSLPAAANLPSAMEASQSDRNGRPPASSSPSPPPAPEVNFAMPGGLDSSTTNTLPVSAAPTDPKKPLSSPGSGGLVAKPVVATAPPSVSVASPSSTRSKPKVSPVVPEVAAVPPGSSPSSSSSSSVTSAARKAPAASSVVPKVVRVDTDEDDDDLKGKPRSKKIKKKKEKQKSNALIYGVGGGVLAIAVIGGIHLMASGGSKKPATSEGGSGSPGEQTQVMTPATQLNDPAAPTPVFTGPFPLFNADLVNVAVNGQVTASKSTGKAKELPQAAFDDDPQTRWVANSAAPWWIRYEFANGVDHAVRQYGIHCSDHKDGTRDPKDWEFQGSTDGIDFVTLDTRKDQTFPDRKQLYVYNVARPTPYRFYRLNVTANGGAKNLLHVAEIGLYAPRPSDISPSANDPAASLTLSTETLPLPRASVPRPSTPAEPEITKDFFPLTPRDVFYNMSWYRFALRLGPINISPPAGGAMPWGVGTQKWTFKEQPKEPKAGTAKAPAVNGTEVTITLIELGYASSPTGTIAKSRQYGIEIGKPAVKIEDGMCQLFWPDSVTKQPIWMPVLKIGTKPGDKWTGTTAVGDIQTYTLTDLVTDDGKLTATVKTERPILKGQIERTTYEFVKGVGMTARVVDRESAKAPAGKKSDPDEELRIKSGL